MRAAANVVTAAMACAIPESLTMDSPNDLPNVLKFPVLIGDIGGTNARFAILVDSYAEPKQFPTVQTADFATIDEAIQTAILDHTSMQPRSAVLAVAGPIDGDEIALTNCDWVVRPLQMLAALGLSDIIVLNDFEAQALAVVALGEEHLEKIGGGAARSGPAAASCWAPAPASASPGWCTPCTPGSPCPAKAAMSTWARARQRDFEIFPQSGDDRRTHFRRADAVRARAGQHLSRDRQGRRQAALLTTPAEMTPPRWRAPTRSRSRRSTCSSPASAGWPATWRWCS